jgi:hypothetical protein
MARSRKFLTFLMASAAPLVGLLSPPSLRAQVTTGGNNKDIREPEVQIPAGTLLPVALMHGLSSRNAKPGKSLVARVMQDVPLTATSKIPAGAKISGTILSTGPAANHGPAQITFRLDRLQIRNRSFPVITNLRAIAGFVEVQFAQTPETSPGFGTPSPWVTTKQIGDDEVYGVGGPVTDRNGQTVGHGVFGGVLVHVRAPDGGTCRGAMDSDDRLQALWVFSSDACGVYGKDGVKILHAGRSEPVGEITLQADQRDVVVRAGDALLLRVDR